MNLRRIYLAAALLVGCVTQGFAQSGVWVERASIPFIPGMMFLLTDGRVLLSEWALPGGPATNHWWTLTPDASGSYLNGTLTRVADSTTVHQSFCSGVLADGRVLVSGGFDGSGNITNLTETYDSA